MWPAHSLRRDDACEQACWDAVAGGGEKWAQRAAGENTRTASLHADARSESIEVAWGAGGRIRGYGRGRGATDLAGDLRSKRKGFSRSGEEVWTTRHCTRRHSQLGFNRGRNRVADRVAMALAAW